MINPFWLGFIVVLGASLFMAFGARRLFNVGLTLEEALSANWVALSIYLAVLVVYVGLKIPFGLSRDTHAPAAELAVCASLIASIYLIRLRTDWKSAVTKSLIGLLTLTLAVAGATLLFIR
jgi:hypothetical protein